MSRPSSAASMHSRPGSAASRPGSARSRPGSGAGGKKRRAKRGPPVLTEAERYVEVDEDMMVALLLHKQGLRTPDRRVRMEVAEQLDDGAKLTALLVAARPAFGVTCDALEQSLEATTAEITRSAEEMKAAIDARAAQLVERADQLQQMKLTRLTKQLKQLDAEHQTLEATMEESFRVCCQYDVAEATAGELERQQRKLVRAYKDYAALALPLAPQENANMRLVHNASEIVTEIKAFGSLGGLQPRLGTALRRKGVVDGAPEFERIPAVVPPQLPAGGGEAVISGTDFGTEISDLSLTIGGVACTQLRWASADGSACDQIACVVPPGTDAVLPLRAEVLLEPSVELETFSYEAPCIDSITPASGLPGTEITIKGSSLGTEATAVVLLGDAKCYSVKVVTPYAEISFRAPLQLSSGKAEVTVRCGAQVSEPSEATQFELHTEQEL